jgi:hypothetical protein
MDNFHGPGAHDKRLVVESSSVRPNFCLSWRTRLGSVPWSSRRVQAGLRRRALTADSILNIAVPVDTRYLLPYQQRGCASWRTPQATKRKSTWELGYIHVDLTPVFSGHGGNTRLVPQCELSPEILSYLRRHEGSPGYAVINGPKALNGSLFDGKLVRRDIYEDTRSSQESRNHHNSISIVFIRSYLTATLHDASSHCHHHCIAGLFGRSSSNPCARPHR